MYDQVKLASLSETIKANLIADDRGLNKEAGLAASEYYRHEIRENGVRRNISDPVTVTDDMLDMDENTDFPTMLVEIAPRSAGAVKVSFETGPSNEVIHGFKSRVEFSRIMTRKYAIDKIRLKGYKMPILDIMHDLMLKDIMDEEDRVTFAVDDAIVGTIDEDNEKLGSRHYVHCGALGRDALVHMKKGLFYTPGRLMPAKYLMNYATYCDFGGLDRNDIGGDMAQDMFVNGVTLTKLQGIDTVVTTKREIVEDNCAYIYAAPKYYGNFFTYQDVSVVTDTVDDIWLSAFSHETIGASVINAAGVAKVKFDGTLKSWVNGME